jgi:drug/metabolite transporter (DMT)-like permease
MGELAAVAAALTWAIGSMLFARIGARVAPGAMNLGKLIASALMLSATYVALGGAVDASLWQDERAWLLMTSGVVGLTIGDTAYFGALVTLGVPRAILLLSSAPVFAALGGAVFLDERLDARAALGVLLTLGGVVLVVVRADGAANLRPNDRVRGLLFGIVAAIGQAAGSLLSRKAMQGGIDPIGAAALRVVVGTLGMLALAGAVGRVRPWIGELRRDRQWLKVAGAASIGSYIGIWLSQYAIKFSSSTGVASTLLATSPAFAMPLAHFTGAERMTFRATLGTILTLAGIAVLTLRAA